MFTFNKINLEGQYRAWETKTHRYTLTKSWGGVFQETPDYALEIKKKTNPSWRNYNHGLFFEIYQ